MQIFRHLIIGTLILLLVIPEVEGGWFKRLFRKIRKGVKKVGKGIGNVVKGAWKGIKKAGCKLFYTLVCPPGVRAPEEGTRRMKGLVVDRCQVRKNKCKRSIDDDMQGLQSYPFSDDFSDYDLNGDKEIEYEEFVFAVMSVFPLGDPEELREPFLWADANGDGRLDMDEFLGAPFMFAHYEPDVAASA